MKAALAADVLVLLDELVAGAIDLDEARQRLAALGTGYPGVRLRLLCEREAYAGGLYPEVAAIFADGAAMLVGLGRDRGLPLLARGAFRPGEDELVRVDGEVLTIVDAIEHLEIAYDPTICRRLVDGLLLGQAQRELGSEPISDDELQAYVDDFRRAHGLHDVHDLVAWLEDRGMTQETLERELEQELRSTQLAHRLVSAKARPYFEQHTRDFDEARLTMVVLADTARGAAVGAALERGVELLAVIEDLRPEDVLDVVVAAPVRRRGVPAPLRDAVFAAPGRWIGADTGAGFVVARITQERLAHWSDATSAAVCEALLEEWLAARRAAAEIEWSWGRVGRS